MKINTIKPKKAESSSKKQAFLKAVSFFMAIIIFANVLSMPALSKVFAENSDIYVDNGFLSVHYDHSVCEGADNCPENVHSEHEKAEWKKWNKTNGLPTEAGNYYLAEDVALTESWYPADGTSLCLNGHIISAQNIDSGIIHIEAGTVFNLCDCSIGGKISGNTANSDGGGVYNNGTFNMFSGEISGNTAVNGGGVYNHFNGVFNMYGGKVRGNTAKNTEEYNSKADPEQESSYNMYSKDTDLSDSDMPLRGEFNMFGGELSDNTAISSSAGGGVFTYGQIVLGGSAVIKNNTHGEKPNNLYIRSGIAVKLDKTLSENADIGITTNVKPTKDNPVILTEENDRDYSASFHSDNPDYEVVNVSDGEKSNVLQLQLAEHKHMICSGSECPDEIHTEHTNEVWEPWESASELPTESGRYYLLNDIKLQADACIESGKDITLCLNGHKVEGLYFIVTEGRFDLCDCGEQGRINVSQINNKGNFYMYGGTVQNQLNGVLSEGTFTMSGGKIYRNKSIGVVCLNQGEFKMYGGSIEKNEQLGVQIGDRSSFTMYGGAIVNNECFQFGSVYNSGQFIMNGGTISDNSKNGVYNNYTGPKNDGNNSSAESCIFIMNGGSIENNAEYGIYNNSGAVSIFGGKVSGNQGGVFVEKDSALNVGGNSIVQDNSKNSDIPCNVYLQPNTLININTDAESSLKEGAVIGVTAEPSDTNLFPLSITKAANGDYSGFFFSDNPDYEIINGENNVLQLDIKRHTHKVCAGADGCTDESHSMLDWIKWTETDRLPTDNRNYYLSENVVLSESWQPADGVSICLNGKTIKAGNSIEGGIIRIVNGSTFNLCDCVGDGEIGNNTAKYAGAVYNDGTFNMYSGTIAGNTANKGGGVFNLKVFNIFGGKIRENTAADDSDGNGMGGGVFNGSADAEFNMYGGEISENRAEVGGGVYASENSIVLGGASVIKDNKSGESQNNLYLSGGEIKITLTDPSGNENIGITTENKPTVKASVDITGTNSSDYSGFFFSDNPAYETVSGTDYKVQLVEIHPHTLVHHDAVIPDCETDGAGEYWACEGENGCGKVFADENGETKLDEIPTIKRLGHKWGKWTLTAEPTETTGGEAERICENNEIHVETAVLPELTDETVWIKIDDFDADCSNEGLRRYTSEYGVVEIILPKLSHDHGNEWQKDPEKHWLICKNCDTVISASENPHSWDDGKITVEPTTEQEGEVIFTCEVCGYTKTEKTPKLESVDTETSDTSLSEPETSDTSTSEPDVSDTSLSEPEPSDTSLSEPEPSDTSISEPEPSDTSASEPEPSDTSTSESEPSDTSTSEPEPSDTSLSEPVPSDTSTSELEPSDTSTSEPEPSDTSISEPEPSDTSLSEPEPSDTSISEPEPSDTSASEPEPSDTSLSGSEPSDTSTSEPEPSDTSSSKPEFFDPSLSETEPTDTSASSESEPTLAPPTETETTTDTLAIEAEPPVTPPIETEPPVPSELEPSRLNETSLFFALSDENNTAEKPEPEFMIPVTTSAEQTVNEETVSDTEPLFDFETGETTTAVQIVNEPAQTTKQGSISKKVESSDYNVDIFDSIPDLVNNLLAQQERTLISKGSIIEILLTIDKLDSISETDRTAIRETLSGGKLWQYLDINLYKVIDEEEYELNSIDSPIKIKINIPETLSKSGMEYGIIRVHDGEAEIIEDLDSSGDTVTFTTDRFSVYALFYKEAEANEDGPLDTGDNSYTSIFLATGITALSAAMTFTFIGNGLGGMSEERKNKLYNKLIRWGKGGGKTRKAIALALIFLLLSYYYSIGVMGREKCKS